MMNILHTSYNSDPRERGQVLVLATGFLFLVLLVAVMVVDGGFFLRARRDSQNTADAAALAGAQNLPNNPVAAAQNALEWASLNGWTDGEDGVTVTVTTPYEGNPNKIEVTVAGGARGVGFFDALMNVSSRALAEVRINQSGSGPGGGDGSNPMAPVPGTGPGGACAGTDRAVVDGRVMPGEGYEKVADLKGGTTDFGDAFFACDGGYFYFALRLNGPSTGGAVANENVYGPTPKKGGPPGYHQIYQTGWTKHTFGNLLGSDRARFQVACGTTPVHDFVQDYLRLVSTNVYVSDTVGKDAAVIVAGPSASSSSMVYNLMNRSATHWGDSAGEDPLTQSPPFNPKYPTYASEYNGWVWEVLYEFKVPRSAYAGCGSGVFFGVRPFPGQTGPVGGVHSSPPKVAAGSSVLLSTIEILLVE